MNPILPVDPHFLGELFDRGGYFELRHEITDPIRPDKNVRIGGYGESIPQHYFYNVWFQGALREGERVPLVAPYSGIIIEKTDGFYRTDEEGSKPNHDYARRVVVRSESRLDAILMHICADDINEGMKVVQGQHLGYMETPPTTAHTNHFHVGFYRGPTQPSLTRLDIPRIDELID